MHEATAEGAAKLSLGDDQGSEGMKLVKVWRAASVGDITGEVGESCIGEGDLRGAWIVISSFNSGQAWTCGSSEACSGS